MHQASKRTAGKRIANWIVSALLSIAALAPFGAMAQNTQPAPPSAAPPPAAPSPGAGRLLPAPVGHRQVRPTDLPPDAAKNENRGEQGLRDFDAKLRICKGC
jgi:hypothetical protein